MSDATTQTAVANVEQGTSTADTETSTGGPAVAAASDAKKIVVVGDAGCGKTSMLFNFVSGERLPEYLTSGTWTDVPAEVKIDDQSTPVTLSEMPSQSGYKRLRSILYENAAVAILCFDITNPKTLASATGEWEKEVRCYLPDIPLILVGNKADLRSPETAEKCVPFETAVHGAKMIKAIRYVECSAKTNEGVQDIFKIAASAPSQLKEPTSKFCC